MQSGNPGKHESLYSKNRLAALRRSELMLTSYAEKPVVAASKSETESSAGHRRDIDGLRAVAVLAVLGFHCGIPWLGGGFVGVDIFFAISGYLICLIIYRDLRSGTFSIAAFYERRFKRILPALSVVLA